MQHVRAGEGAGVRGAPGMKCWDWGRLCHRVFTTLAFGPGMTPTELRLLQHVMCRNVIGIHSLFGHRSERETESRFPDTYDVDHLPEVPLKGRLFDHWFISTPENATLSFLKFGICEPRNSTDRGVPFGIFTLDFEDVPAHIAAFVTDGDPDLTIGDYLDEHTMCAYLWTAQDPSWAFPTKNGPALPTSNEAFDCPDVWKTDLELFTACGYADKIGDKYQWSPKMAQIMMDVYLWDREGNPM